jgi:hypothetical protein
LYYMDVHLYIFLFCPSAGKRHKWSGVFHSPSVYQILYTECNLRTIFPKLSPRSTLPTRPQAPPVRRVAVETNNLATLTDATCTRSFRNNLATLTPRTIYTQEGCCRDNLVTHTPTGPTVRRVARGTSHRDIVKERWRRY